MNDPSECSHGLPRVTAFTITYNQLDRVRATLLGLLDQLYPSDRYEIVVLDDGSTDGTPEMLVELAHTARINVRVLCEAHEADYMSARRWNQCIEASDRRTGVFLQVDDVLVRRDLIRSHVKWHIGREDYIVTGAKYEGPRETWALRSCRRGRLASRGGGAAEVRAFTAAWGASMSFSRKMAHYVSVSDSERPYDEAMLGWGHHEVELAARMQKHGATLVYDPSAGVFHRDHTREGEQARGIDRDQLIDRGQSENRDYILRKHGLTELPRW